MLKGSEKLEDALLLTTIEEGLSSENWQKLTAAEGHGGRLLLIAGGDLSCRQTCSPEASGHRRGLPAGAYLWPAPRICKKFLIH